MNTKISQMTLEDLEEISSSLLDEFDDFWNISTFKLELSNPNSKYIVLKENNYIVGFAGIWFGYKEVHITNIAIRKSKRRQGYGLILLSELVKLAKQRDDILSITLEVKENNTSAIRIIRKIKF